MQTPAATLHQVSAKRRINSRRTATVVSANATYNIEDISRDISELISRFISSMLHG